MEPLLTTAQRTSLESDFADLARRDPRWFEMYCSLVLSGIVASLPDKDPWRSVSLVDNAHDGVVALRPDGTPFGTVRDTADVTHPVAELEALGIDPWTLALTEHPSLGAAELVVVAFDGWRAASDVLRETTIAHGPGALYERATSAIRWAEHRRRSYRPGVFDSWFEFLTIECASRAESVASNDEPVLSDDDIARDAAKERGILDQIAQNQGIFR